MNWLIGGASLAQRGIPTTQAWSWVSAPDLGVLRCQACF